MKINLRFGMHKDIDVIHEAQDLIDGFVIPAHILAHQTAPTAAFVCSLPGRNYVIDPMTWILQSPRKVHRTPSDDIRPSVGKWCDVIHADLRGKVMSGSQTSSFAVAELPDLKQCCQGNLRFQTESVNLGHVDPRAKKYLDRYGTTVATLPRCILPPYFQFFKIGDDWYNTTLAAAQITKSLTADLEIAPVIMCSSRLLDAPGIIRIADEFGKFKRCFIWIENFAQGAVVASEIRNVRNLVTALAKKGCEAEALYGGFMMMMMEYDGMSGVSHGILYGQDKAGEQVPGGGGVPERYYIPKFHEFRSLSQTNLILKKHPELTGGTPTSDSVMAGDPDRVFLFASRPDLLRRHFLEARRVECDLLATDNLANIVASLKATHAKYHTSVSKLPNPDALITGGEQKGLDYLISWADAFSS